MFLIALGCADLESRCEELESEELADDEHSPDGPTGAEVLSLAAQMDETSLHWSSGVTNADGDTVLRLTLERAAAPVRFVRTEQTGNAKADLGCGADLIVPVLIQIDTDDGALDEAIETDLVHRIDGPITAESTATLAFAFAFEDLTGSLVPASSPDGTHGELTATVGATLQGQIGVVVEQDAGERYETAASWGPQL